MSQEQVNVDNVAVETGDLIHLLDPAVPQLNLMQGAEMPRLASNIYRTSIIDGEPLVETGIDPIEYMKQIVCRTCRAIKLMAQIMVVIIAIMLLVLLCLVTYDFLVHNFVVRIFSKLFVMATSPIYNKITETLESITKEEEIPKDLLYYLEYYISFMYNFLYRFVERMMQINGMFYMQLLLVFLIMLFSLAVLRRIVGKRTNALVRNTMYRIRGIQYESMMPNSEFTAGTIPRYQVAIHKPGMLSDTFIGYGLRYGNTLITPSHVLTPLGDEILLVNGNVKAVVPRRETYSQNVNDVSYVDVSQNIWSQLGVATMKNFVHTYKPMTVSCAGREGVSNGRLFQTDILGILSYKGSTLSGYSGAAYYVNNTCYGMHTGAAPNTNCGVTSGLFFKELPGAILPESSPDEDVRLQMHTTQTKKGWNDADFRTEIDQEDPFWDVDPDEIWNFTKENATENKRYKGLGKLSVDERRRMIKLLESLNNIAETTVSSEINPNFVNVRIAGQSDNPVPVNVTGRLFGPHRGTRLIDVVTDIQTRIQNLEDSGIDEAETIIKNHLSNFQKKLDKMEADQKAEVEKLRQSHERKMAILEEKYKLMEDQVFQSTSSNINKITSDINKYKTTLVSTQNQVGETVRELQSVKDSVRELAADACLQHVYPVKPYSDHQCDLCSTGYHTLEQLHDHQVTVHGVDRASFSEGKPMPCRTYQKMGGDDKCPAVVKTFVEVVRGDQPPTPPPATKPTKKPLKPRKQRDLDAVEVIGSPIVGESAFSGDNQNKTVRTAPFLGEPKDSKTKRSKRSRKNSRLSGLRKQYQLLEVTQSEMMKCLKNLEKRLAQQPQLMAGPSSAVTRN